MTTVSRDILRGKVIILKDLVSYEEGAITSRMIINNKAGSITIFSFDKNEGLSEHSAPFDAVLTVLDGECEVQVAGTPHRLKDGETIIFPANVTHSVFAVMRFKMMLTMIMG